MSSYGSTYSGQLHPSYQPPPQQQRARSYSNPPYPTTPAPAQYPQQQLNYFPPPPIAPYQQGPPSTNPIAIPASNRTRASSEYTYGSGASPQQQASSPCANSYPTHHLQPILQQQQPIPENYQYSPQQQQQSMTSNSPGYSHDRRRSSSSQYGYETRQSYESAHSYQSAHSHHGHSSPDHYVRQSQNGYGNYDDRINYSNEHEEHRYAHTHAALEPPKGYGDWDKNEVARYQKNQDLERRPTLGGSLISFVKRISGSDRR